MARNEYVSTNKDGVLSALKEAISAVYFNDNSDYESALYSIICHLGGDKARMMIDMGLERDLYREYCGEDDND